MSAQIVESIMEKLPITVNGREKFATGLNKQTTIDDIKFAMLSVTQPEFKMQMLNEYAIVERWQGNERMLDGRIKIHKLLRLWQSVPGNQLEHVQFYVKKIARAPHTEAAKLTVRDENVPARPAKDNARFAFCTLSPDMAKTWHVEKAKRGQAKSSYVKRQLQLIADKCDAHESSDDGENAESPAESYASIKRTNRSRTCTIQKTSNESRLRAEFIDLVNKQNEIIAKQLNKLALATTRPRKPTLSSKLTASIVKTSKRLINSIDINTKQTEEVAEMSNVLSKMDDMITLKTKFIESLEHELKVLDEMNDDDDDEDLCDSDTQLLIGESVRKQSSTSTLLSKLSSKSSLLSNLSIGLAQCGNKSSYSECDSDTGISSACSDDSHHLETLV
jgi:hypothetical protein